MAKLFDEHGKFVSDIPGDYRGEKIRYQGRVYQAEGYFVPETDRDGSTRFYMYRVDVPRPDTIVEVEDDGVARMSPRAKPDGVEDVR